MNNILDIIAIRTKDANKMSGAWACPLKLNDLEFATLYIRKELVIEESIKRLESILEGDEAGRVGELNAWLKELKELENKQNE